MNRRIAATPLFIVLLMVETTDLIIAADSVPAVLVITTDPFIVYTSNVFAVLGRRSMFFALSGVLKLFQYLHYGLAAVLVFVGLKMLISDVYRVSTTASLIAIASLLAGAMIASVILANKRAGKRPIGIVENTPRLRILPSVIDLSCDHVQKSEGAPLAESAFMDGGR